MKAVLGASAINLVLATFAHADATWYCSALLEKGDTKPAALKFQVKGGELIDLSGVLPNDYIGKLAGGVKELTRYKITLDTDMGLVASNSMAYVDSLDKKATVFVDTILINKVSGEFIEMAISTEGPYIDYRGTCQLGK
jgi:hypothetical protein